MRNVSGCGTGSRGLPPGRPTVLQVTHGGEKRQINGHVRAIGRTRIEPTVLLPRAAMREVHNEKDTEIRQAAQTGKITLALW